MKRSKVLVTVVLSAVVMAGGLALLATGCKSDSALTVPGPTMLTVRWADGAPMGDLVLVSMNGLPYNSLRGAWRTWERNKAVPLSLGSHTLIVRLPYSITQFGYKEVRSARDWTIRVSLPEPGTYTAFLDPESSDVTATADIDGSSVIVMPPVADPNSGPSTNKPAAPLR